MKKCKLLLPIVVILLGIWLCGYSLQSYIHTETGLKKVAEKSLKKKYNEEFVVHNVWSKNQDVFYADCSPKNNAEIVFRADVYKNGKGVEADSYQETILGQIANQILLPDFQNVFGNCYTRVVLGLSYYGEMEFQEDLSKKLQLQEYLKKSSDRIVCDVYTEMHDVSEKDMEAEYNFLASALPETIQVNICPDADPKLKVMIHFVDEDMLENSKEYFRTNTIVRGEFDSALMKYGEIICIYEDGNIDIGYGDYRERRLKYEELRKNN